ncbi:putative protease Do-like 14 [Triticum dicoccoides]|uniref:putative protease Do-like 14 n=1 Tax=Triticum dicoccoides TaxID=85692 RepID=UPI00188E3A32|nr:putative protease Do-like 14 [Triticum dicoccoides]
MASPTPPAATDATAGAGAGAEMPPKDEDAAIRLRRSLFGSDEELEQEPESPSSSGEDSGASDSSEDDFTEEGLRARDAVLSVAKSVVALAASVDGDPSSTFACTGTVVAREGLAAWIMTSATLIRKHDSGTEVHELSSVKIEVLLPNKKVVKGQLLMYDLHYNVAIVSVECEADLLVAVLADLPGSYFLTPTPVVSVAWKFESGSLQLKRGETFRAVSELDCNELMVCTCQMEPQRQNKDNSIQYITTIFIGGLLIDLEGRIVGMNFIDENKTPFLPVQLVGRCLKHFRKFGRIKQPFLGIRGRGLHMLELKDLEKICHKYHKPPSGILVEKISEVSSANCGGIEAGDIINKLDGVVLHSPAQLTTMLLDTMEVAVNMQPVVLQATVLRPRDGTTFVANLKVVECPHGECHMLLKNRWRLPPPKEYWWGPSEWHDYSD